MNRQRLQGLVLVALGVGLSALAWYTAGSEGVIKLAASVGGPAFAVAGLAQAIWGLEALLEPNSRTEKGDPIYDFKDPQYSWSGCGVLFAGILAGIGYTLLLKYGL